MNNPGPDGKYTDEFDDPRTGEQIVSDFIAAVSNISSANVSADNDYGDQEEWEREWEMGLWWGDQFGTPWHRWNPDDDPAERPARWLNPPRRVTSE